MFTLLPNADAPLARFVLHHPGPLLFGAFILVAVTVHAMVYGVQSDGASVSSTDDWGDGGGDSCGD